MGFVVLTFKIKHGEAGHRVDNFSLSAPDYLEEKLIRDAKQFVGVELTKDEVTEEFSAPAIPLHLLLDLIKSHGYKFQCVTTAAYPGTTTMVRQYVFEDPNEVVWSLN